MDKKALSLPILISLVVGNMIGTGIYVLPASLAQYGSLSLIAWIYTSLGAIVLALTFVHLTKRFPKTGGPYIYCKEAFGKPTGFVIAYAYWIGNLVSIAGIAVASISYIGFLSPIFDANTHYYNHTLSFLIEIAVIWLFTFINILGIHTAGVVQLGLTLIKVIPLLLITLIGMSFIHADNLFFLPKQDLSTMSAVGSAAALTFWAFIGLESATVPAENTRGYRDIYKATMVGTLLTALLYIGSTVVLMGIIPNADLKNSQFPFALAGTLLFGSHGATLIAFCAILSGLGALNVCILIQGQIVFAAARDGLFPARFSKLSKHDVPVAAQLLSSSLVTLFLMMTLDATLIKQFNKIALFAALFSLITYLVTSLAEIKFLLQNKRPLYPILYSRNMIITILATVYSLWMVSNLDLSIILIGLFFIIMSLPIYFFMID